MRTSEGRRSGKRAMWAVTATVTIALIASACGSSSKPQAGHSTTTNAVGSATTASGGASQLSTAEATAAKYEKIPTQILATTAFTPAQHKTIYNIACNLALVGCSAIPSYIKQAAAALGYGYSLCNGGTTSQQADACFNNAINAKSSVIITNAVGTNTAADGYRAAAAAGIPVVPIFSGDSPGAPGVKTEVGGTACSQEGGILGDAVIAQTQGKANVLFAYETSIACDAQRASGFQQALAACSTCQVSTLQFSEGTMQTTLPGQLTAAIESHPNLNYVAGVFDQAASLAVTAVQQAGKQGSISVAGMDGNPSNIQLIQSGKVQNLDAAFGQEEAAYAGVDAAARILAGSQVPAVTDVTIFLITAQDVGQVPVGGYKGPTDMVTQYKKLWGVS